MTSATYPALPIKTAGDPLPAGVGGVIAQRPTNPSMREGVNIWFFEENGAFGVPRLAVDAVGESWDKRLVCANFSLPDGRVFDGWNTFPAVPTLDGESKPSIVGCTVLQFSCIEPMHKWRLSYDDEPQTGTVEEQIAKRMDPSRKARVRLNAEITFLPPPWAQYFAQSDRSFAARAMGIGWRYEVPCKVEGTFEVDGKARTFKGTGIFVHRQSIRDFAGFWGHCWQAAAFPDGNAFGFNVYPKKEGQPEYNTGYIYKDGKSYDARVVEAPWLHKIVARDDDVSAVLESELGRTRIKGRTVLTTFKPSWGLMGGLNLEQSGVRYTWGDQSAIGMIERSL